nr:pasha [Amrasca biguttula biguttula]
MYGSENSPKKSEGDSTPHLFLDESSHQGPSKIKRCNSISSQSINFDHPEEERVKKCAKLHESSSVCNESSIESSTDIELREDNSKEMHPKLLEFDVLDDIEESDGEGADVQAESQSESATDSDQELPVEDVDAMLEESLPEKFKDPSKADNVLKVKRKVILEEIGHDHFDLLPEGWIQIMHNSGMPLYLHQKSRVCTMSRPYFLGPGSSRSHKVPLSAIPCLQYKRTLEAEKKDKEAEKSVDGNDCQPDNQLIGAKMETSEENAATQSLEAIELHNYCEKVFKFKTITLMPFKSWSDRRKYVRMTKDVKKRQRPTLPSGTKLLKFPVQNSDGNPKSKKEWIINPNGKSNVCILHEYVQQALKNHPKYEFKELANPATPYSATVLIGDMKYGVGLGASKKQAKNEAARSALEVLIPEMRDTLEPGNESSGSSKTSQNNDLSIFDQIRIEDPRVAEFCAKTTEPPPYTILLTCLTRNMGLGNIQVNYEMNTKQHKEDEFTMIVGNHKATVLCKNKREGKQRAAQAILQALHPNIKNWGSLLRMYGNRSVKSVKEKKQEEQEITSLQSKAAQNQPNYAILNKLRTEMLKLKEKKDAIKAKGKFLPPQNTIPSLSTTDLDKVNLN